MYRFGAAERLTARRAEVLQKHFLAKTPGRHRERLRKMVVEWKARGGCRLLGGHLQKKLGGGAVGGVFPKSLWSCLKKNSNTLLVLMFHFQRETKTRLTRYD